MLSMNIMISSSFSGGELKLCHDEVTAPHFRSDKRYEYQLPSHYFLGNNILHSSLKDTCGHVGVEKYTTVSKLEKD